MDRVFKFSFRGFVQKFTDPDPVAQKNYGSEDPTQSPEDGYLEDVFWCID
jgi:hypothetical protein